MRLCHEAGFREVTIRALSYASGEIQLSLEQLIRWKHWTRQRRPLRVMHKLWQLVQEFLGTAKEGALFEESLGMWVSRVLARHMSEQALVIASKSSLTELPAPYAADVQVIEVVEGESNHVVAVRCRNLGTALWRAHGKHRVQVGIQLLDRSHQLLDREYARATLPGDIEPQQIVLYVVPCQGRNEQASFGSTSSLITSRGSVRGT